MQPQGKEETGDKIFPQPLMLRRRSYVIMCVCISMLDVWLMSECVSISINNKLSV